MNIPFRSIIKLVFVGLLLVPLFIQIALVQEAYASGWKKTFGGSAGYSVQQTSDGGYIVVGSSGSNVCLIKTDTGGNKLWQETFGGEDYDYGYSVQQTSDGGYIVAGECGGDVCLIKTDTGGSALWQKTFGRGSGHSVQQTSDGGYIIAGETDPFGDTSGDVYLNYDVYLIKTDASGNKLWQETFGGEDSDFGRSVQQTGDGGYIVAGYTYSYGAGSSDVYLIKTDAFGNAQWQETFGGEDSDVGYSVQQTSDGGYIIVGDTRSYGAGWADIYLIKTDAFGNLEWQKTFGVDDIDEGYEGDAGYSVQQTSDGGYIVTGEYSDDIYLLKTDAYGIREWQKIFSGYVGYSVQQTSDGGYIVAGDCSGGICLIKTDAYGNID